MCKCLKNYRKNAVKQVTEKNDSLFSEEEKKKDGNGEIMKRISFV